MHRTSSDLEGNYYHYHQTSIIVFIQIIKIIVQNPKRIAANIDELSI
jgi:hypothetical protein